MGIIKRGILGGFSKKVGDIVGTSWKGIAVIKSRPLSVANPNTAGQVEQRGAFKNCSQYASQILTSLIIPLMNRFAIRQSGFNRFIQLNVKEFNETGLVNQDLINFGTGKLGDTPILTGTVNVAGGTVNVTYSNVASGSFQLGTDRAFIMARERTTLKLVAAGDSGEIRSGGSATIPILNPVLVGATVDLYLVFLRADGTEVGNTDYLPVIAV